MGRVTRINPKSPSNMAEEIQTSKSDSRAPSGRVHPLVILSCRLRGIASMDPGVSKRKAKRLAASDPTALEEKLRDFVAWYANHAENTTQTLERAIYAFDEDNVKTQERAAMDADS